MNHTISSDENSQLIKKISEGDPDAIKKFFDIYSLDIYNFPIKVFHLTEDDAGDFFIYAFERLRTGKRFRSYIGKSSFKTWFYSVLRNLLIDWQRTKRDIKVQAIIKVGKDGVEYKTIEDEADTYSGLMEEANEVSTHFQNIVSDIKLESRVVFKLYYIYYLHLDPEEQNYIMQKTGRSLSDIKTWVIQTRENLSSKEEENIKSADKITSIYLSILDLKEQQKTNANQMTEDYPQGSNLPYVDKVTLALQKKYEQRRKLIEKKNKGHFLVKTPHREIAHFLEVSEGSVSVTLIRTLEKIQKKVKKDNIF